MPCICSQGHQPHAHGRHVQIISAHNLTTNRSKTVSRNGNFPLVVTAALAPSGRVKEGHCSCCEAAATVHRATSLASLLETFEPHPPTVECVVTVWKLHAAKIQEGRKGFEVKHERNVGHPVVFCVNSVTNVTNKQDMQCTCNVTFRRFRESFLPWKSNKCYIFLCVYACVCGCVCAWAYAGACARVALFIQHATRKRHIVLAFVALLIPLHFTLSHKRHDFRKKKLLNIKRVI